MSKRLSLIRRFEHFLASERGKRILNYFYSWGAAFVILGALFKLLHIRYGDEILLVSMLTEFAVFFISGFERPEIGRKGSESSDKAYPSSAILHQQHQLAVTSTDLPEQGQGDTDTLTSNITELNAIYARQVKELRAQLENIERISANLQHMHTMYEAGAKDSSTFRQQNERLISQLEQLNAAYARMLQALTVNMNPPNSSLSSGADEPTQAK